MRERTKWVRKQNVPGRWGNERESDEGMWAAGVENLCRGIVWKALSYYKSYLAGERLQVLR